MHDGQHIDIEHGPLLNFTFSFSDQILSSDLEMPGIAQETILATGDCQRIGNTWPHPLLSPPVHLVPKAGSGLHRSHYTVSTPPKDSPAQEVMKSSHESNTTQF